MKYDMHQIGRLRYLLTYPEDFNPEKTYPTIFLLHGAGSRGTDLNKLMENAYFQDIQVHPHFPFVTVAPQCSDDTWFDMMDCLKNLAEHTAKLPFVDSSRLYLMGPSMGGYGTWQLAMSIPEYFAAIVPICGGGMYWNAGRLLNVPVWAFHGALDDCVLCRESQQMVDSVNAFGGNAKLTVYPDLGHGAWTRTYRNPEVFQWLLSHQNQNGKRLVNRYEDTVLFG